MGLKAWQIAAGAMVATLLTVGFVIAQDRGRALAVRETARGESSALSEQVLPAPLPGWVKYQWLSWYDVGMGVNEDHLNAEIDYIAENLADLGPWHILVDAGWYVSEGRPDSDWRSVDSNKFPSGLRSVVDYAHSRGIRVVLYIALPYLNDAQAQGNWLGLRGIIEKHPDWLIPLGSGENGNGYIYNFANPALRAYMADVLKDFFVKYNVDGIKVDGFSEADREIRRAVERGVFSRENSPSSQAEEVYRFVYENAIAHKPDAYVEAGWFPPPSANSFIHTVRYGDEYFTFSNPFPFGGLQQHVDYALTQRSQLGQRPNMGAIFGNADDVSVGYQWLEAGLALSTQVVLGFNLPSMSKSVLDGYRARLSQYNAFSAEPIVGGNGRDIFASRSNRTTYLGAINQDTQTKMTTVNLADYGLNPTQSYLVYDVVANSYFRASGSITFEVPSQRFRLFLLRDEIGVMWTNASFQQEYAPGQLRIVVNGPSSLNAYVNIHTPAFAEVSLDGVPLAPDLYSYDGPNNVLTLVFGYNGGPREVKIVY